MTIFCKECGNTMRINHDGTSCHIKQGRWCDTFDHNQDADHVAVVDESGLRYIHIYGYKTEEDLDNGQTFHIDSISEDGDWEQDVSSIVTRENDNYHHITVENDDGKTLSFQ